MQNNKAKNLNFTEILSNEPDNILSLDVSSVKTLQIGYQAETLFLHKATDDTLTIKEYINGLTGSEYYAKVTANRFKTTIRYGRREAVNPATCIEIFLPDSYNGELLLSSQYGNIMTDADWKVERFAAETTEGSISLNTITAPRIRLVSSTSLIHITKAEGFTDIHSVSGTIIAAGAGVQLGLQGFINIGVVTYILPNTGLPLPFVSYGLTSLVCSFIEIGFVLNVGLQCKEK